MDQPVQAVAPDDPLMEHSPDGVFWTTVNTGEGRPGVSTPLSQSFWGEATEIAMKRTFRDYGVLRDEEVRYHDAAHNTIAMFYGRCAANVDVLRSFMDRTPGMTGEGFERQLLGSSRAGLPAERGWSRIPVVLAKLPRVLFGNPGILRRAADEQDRWWRDQVRPEALADVSGAPDRLSAAVRRFEDAMWLQTRSTFLCVGFFDQLVALTERTGLGGIEHQLIGGYGTLLEGQMVTDMWAVSRGRLRLEDMLDRWGYHGPREAELLSRTWREDPAPLVQAIAAYAERGEAHDPARQATTRAADRRQAEAKLLTALGPMARTNARILLRLLRTNVPLREVGKAMYVQAVDAGRAAARTIADRWAADGVLKHPDDLFFLTIEEIHAGPRGELREIVEIRRALYESYLPVTLPKTWYGNPEPIPLRGTESGGPDRCERLTGIGVSVGVVEGRARVVIDPADSAPLEPGDVLVCSSTDPSWASLFVLAGALITDIGGPLSHGAIVARELGVPAVVNTLTGTTTIRTGDLVRVDGAAGTVELLENGSP